MPNPIEQYDVQENDARDHFQYLMALPINNPDRATLRELVKTPDHKLAAKCRKYLTLGAVYAERERLDKERADDAKTTPYRKWLASIGICGKAAESFIARTAGRHSCNDDTI